MAWTRFHDQVQGLGEGCKPRNSVGPGKRCSAAMVDWTREHCL